MKRTEHKATEADVLAMLALSGQMPAVQIGERLWPDKIGYGAPRGGPSSVAVSAAYMLGRMRAKGLVEKCRDNWNWELTAKGQAKLTGKEPTHGTGDQQNRADSHHGRDYQSDAPGQAEEQDPGAE